MTRHGGEDDRREVRDGTVVVYKGSPDAGPLRDRATSAGRLEGARVGELIGLPGQRIDELAQVPDGPISYLATVILPAVAGHR